MCQDDCTCSLRVFEYIIVLPTLQVWTSTKYTAVVLGHIIDNEPGVTGKEGQNVMSPSMDI